jgi:hypothetical protein
MCTLQALQLLLDAGGTPECRDKVSMEGPFDVAQNDEIRTILVRMIVSVSVSVSVFALLKSIHSSST